MRYLSILLLTMTVLARAPLSLADDWTQFRGPGRKNVSTETGWLTEWSDAGPPLTWQASVGIGNGTVVTSTDEAYGPEGRGFVQGGMRVENPEAAPETDRRGTKGDSHSRRAEFSEILSSVDLGEGTVKWRYVLHKHYRKQHSSPHSTPAIDADRVYAYGTLGVLACVDGAGGKEIWRRDLPEELGLDVKKYGVTGSPKVHGDHVYVISLVKSRKTVGVIAFDKVTGQEAWRKVYDIGGQSPHSSPVIGQVDGKTTLLCHLGQAVVGLDPASGREYWKLDYLEAIPELKAGRVYSSESWPIVLDNGLIVDRIWNDVGGHKGTENRAAGALGRTLAFRVSDGKCRIVWDNPEVSAYYLGIQPWEGYLYCFDNKHVAKTYQWDRANLTCLDAATGKTMWQSKDWALPIRAEAKRYRRGPCITMTIADGRMLINDGIHVVLGNCSPKGFERIDTFVEDLTPWSAPVLSHRRLYLRGGEKLFCYDFRN